MLWRELGQDFQLYFIPPICPHTVPKRSGCGSSSSTAISGDSECDLVLKVRGFPTLGETALFHPRFQDINGQDASLAI